MGKYTKEGESILVRYARSASRRYHSRRYHNNSKLECSAVVTCASALIRVVTDLQNH